MVHTPSQLKALYVKGQNISELMREEKGLQINTDEIIEIAYDLQTGTYTAEMEDPEIKKHKNDYTSELAKVILSLCNPETVLEAGVGEATTFAGVLKNLKSNVHGYGFDLSWSRVFYARRWLQSQSVFNATLCTGNLFAIPFADNSIDVVYTSHSIEPNGGNEQPILKELFRITKNFLILLEPAYELASKEVRQRMDSYGYCKDLKNIAETLGYTVLEHKLFPFSSNQLNPTAITIIKKDNREVPSSHIFACPKYKTPLKKIENMFFSSEALAIYPIVDGIPCLRSENSIFASKYEEIV